MDILPNISGPWVSYVKMKVVRLILLCFGENKRKCFWRCHKVIEAQQIGPAFPSDNFFVHEAPWKQYLVQVSQAVNSLEKLFLFVSSHVPMPLFPALASVLSSYQVAPKIDYVLPAMCSGLILVLYRGVCAGVCEEKRTPCVFVLCGRSEHILVCMHLCVTQITTSSSLWLKQVSFMMSLVTKNTKAAKDEKIEQCWSSLENRDPYGVEQTEGPNCKELIKGQVISDKINFSRVKTKQSKKKIL